MKNLRSLIIIGIICLLFGSNLQGQVRDAITLAADRLVNNQTVGGFWTDEENFTGSIVAGLVGAYEIMGKTAYKTAAESGGSYIMSAAGGNYYGDEAYALTRLSDIATDPDDNAWRTEVARFYKVIRMNEGGTAAYIDGFSAYKPCNAVFYMAHHVVAAYYVDATDKALWRWALIDYLSEVADDYPGENFGLYPVLSLGVATWALAKTGPLDPFIWVGSQPAKYPYWNGVTLADLPDLLLSHQVPEGDAYAGSFYWRFDHAKKDNPVSRGYTEDTVFPVLGLVAAAGREYTHEYDDAIIAARDAMPIAVDDDPSGKVYPHIWQITEDPSKHYYAGESLHALRAAIIKSDFDDDLDVDILDLYKFSLQWLNTGCAYPNWCGRADFNFSGNVNLFDYVEFSRHWHGFVGI
ncbi:MAG: hypothetical protein AMJ79_12030 [Phycisphaerae bacterium SM23_30]|nr:MAG: hypothetical protein AMJ79_12030 [Phycisphaerae bacterium SM23_30]